MSESRIGSSKSEVEKVPEPEVKELTLSGKGIKRILVGSKGNDVLLLGADGVSILDAEKPSADSIRLLAHPKMQMRFVCLSAIRSSHVL